jgi:type 2A phosphatase activator TIP41
VIPVEKLGPSNPVIFYQQGSFYEDELDDNGLIQYEYKFRAMATCWFGLIRNYARVDEVTVQIYDTRIYWEEGWSKIARQFMVKKASWS